MHRNTTSPGALHGRDVMSHLNDLDQWRPEALFQCHCSGVGIMHRYVSGSGVLPGRDVTFEQVGPVAFQCIISTLHWNNASVCHRLGRIAWNDVTFKQPGPVASLCIIPTSLQLPCQLNQESRNLNPQRMTHNYHSRDCHFMKIQIQTSLIHLAWKSYS